MKQNPKKVRLRIAVNYYPCTIEYVQSFDSFCGFKNPLGDAFGSFLRRTLRPHLTGQPKASPRVFFGQPQMAAGSSAPTDRGGSTVAKARFRIRDKTTNLTLVVARSQNGTLAGSQCSRRYVGEMGRTSSLHALPGSRRNVAMTFSWGHCAQATHQKECSRE